MHYLHILFSDFRHLIQWMIKHLFDALVVALVVYAVGACGAWLLDRRRLQLPSEPWDELHDAHWLPQLQGYLAQSTLVGAVRAAWFIFGVFRQTRDAIPVTEIKISRKTLEASAMVGRFGPGASGYVP